MPEKSDYVPAKAFLVLIVLMGGGVMLGFVAASWIVPLCFAVGGEGLDGLRQVPVQWGYASPPAWLNHRTAEGLKLVGGVLGLALGGLLGIGGGKLSHHLVVHKFGWMTEEQVRRFNARTPRW
jgi:hypothetical protein